MTLTAIILSLALLQAEPAAAPPDGKPPVYSFAERQEQLVEMARLLGRMHHLHQTCQPYDYLPDRFRDRMKELVALEEPPAPTKSSMVAAFNQGYQATKSSYDYCSSEAEAAMRQYAKDGSVMTQKLSSPFRDIGGYDYYTDEEPVE